ncbi:MAG: hypothetical protein ACK5LJ_11710 [Paracoccus sp. (in: a-proteobacteria)]
MPAFEPPEWLEKLWQVILSLGDVSGKLLTLVALPSAIAAIIAFYDEIGDVLSAPEVRAEMTSLGLRCGLELDTQTSIEEARDAPQEACNAAPLSTWVGLTLVNEDSIARTVVSVEAQLKLPAVISGTARDFTWRNVRSVEHPIVNDVQSVWLVGWRAIHLEPAEEIPIELDFRHFELSEEISFGALAQAVQDDPSPLVGEAVEITICGRFSGQEICTPLSHCRAVFGQNIINEARGKDIIRAITTHSGVSCEAP